MKFRRRNTVCTSCCPENLAGEFETKELDDLADLSGDELTSAEDGILREFGLSADDASQIVMAARAHWFEDEESDANADAEEEISAD